MGNTITHSWSCCLSLHEWSWTILWWSTGVHLWRRDDSVLHAAHSGKLDQSICWHIKLAVLWSQLPCARCQRRSGMFVRSLRTVNAMVEKTALCNSMQDKTGQYSEPYNEMSLVMSRRYNKDGIQEKAIILKIDKQHTRGRFSAMPLRRAGALAPFSRSRL